MLSGANADLLAAHVVIAKDTIALPVECGLTVWAAWRMSGRSNVSTKSSIVEDEVLFVIIGSWYGRSPLFRCWRVFHA